MRKLLMVLALALLAACAAGPRNSPTPEVYDFGLPAPRVVSDGRWSKVVLEIRAPHWFDSSSIEYRLLYDDPLKLRSYAGSRWAGAPGLLLSQRLRQQLGVLGSSGQAAVNCLLRLELQEFSQAFDTPQHSRGILQGSASIVDARRRVVAERLLAVEQPAATADARGGVRALVAASEELGRQLASWLDELAKTGKLNDCLASPGR